jgi:hypothetical protein
MIETRRGASTYLIGLALVVVPLVAKAVGAEPISRAYVQVDVGTAADSDSCRSMSVQLRCEWQRMNADVCLFIQSTHATLGCLRLGWPSRSTLAMKQALLARPKLPDQGEIQIVAFPS